MSNSSAPADNTYFSVSQIIPGTNITTTTTSEMTYVEPNLTSAIDVEYDDYFDTNILVKNVESSIITQVR